MPTWYRASQDEVKAHHIIRDTPKQVIYMEKQFTIRGPDRYAERREMKESSGLIAHKWCKTQLEGYDYIVEVLQRGYEGKRRALEIAKRKLDDMKARRASIQGG